MAVVGTPGTGKSYFCSKLSKHIKDSNIIDINSIVERYKLYSKLDKFGTKIVKLRELQKIITSEINRAKGVIIIDGHLGVELKLHTDMIIITRTDLKTLEKRLKSRKYPSEKISENLISEAVNYSGSKARSKCSETYEVSNLQSKNTIIKYITNRSKGIKVKRPLLPTIDRLHEMIYFIKNGNPYNF